MTITTSSWLAVLAAICLTHSGCFNNTRRVGRPFDEKVIETKRNENLTETRLELDDINWGGGNLITFRPTVVQVYVDQVNQRVTRQQKYRKVGFLADEEWTKTESAWTGWRSEAAREVKKQPSGTVSVSCVDENLTLIPCRVLSNIDGKITVALELRWPIALLDDTARTIGTGSVSRSAVSLEVAADGVKEMIKVPLAILPEDSATTLRESVLRDILVLLPLGSSGAVRIDWDQDPGKLRWGNYIESASPDAPIISSRLAAQPGSMEFDSDVGQIAIPADVGTDITVRFEGQSKKAKAERGRVVVSFR